jgi:hypothetical protein
MSSLPSCSGERSKCLAKPAALARHPTTAQRFSFNGNAQPPGRLLGEKLENREGGPVGCSKLFGHHQLQQRFLTPSLGLDPPRVVQAAHAHIAADGQPLLADHGHEISQPLTASVRCSRKSTPMDRLTTNRRDKASLSGPRCTRFQYQTGPSIPAHRRKCGLADCWESSACKFR